MTIWLRLHGLALWAVVFVGMLALCFTDPTF